MKHLLLLATLCFAAPAAADTATDAANHAAAGKKAFAEGKYIEAIAAFREANKLQPDPKLLYAIAQAQRMAGDCAGAIVTYEEFIKTKADEKLVEFSQANITRCKEVLAVSQPKPDPKPDPKPEPKPEPKPDPKPEPKPEIKPEPPKPKPVEGGTSWTSDFVGHGLVVAGVAGAVVGTLLWSKGRSNAAAINDATDHESFLAAQDAGSSALNQQRIGIAVGLVGVAAIAGGVIHYRMAGKKEVRVGAAPTRGGGAFLARIQF